MWELISDWNRKQGHYELRKWRRDRYWRLQEREEHVKWLPRREERQISWEVRVGLHGRVKSHLKSWRNQLAWAWDISPSCFIAQVQSEESVEIYIWPGLGFCPANLKERCKGSENVAIWCLYSEGHVSKRTLDLLVALPNQLEIIFDFFLSSFSTPSHQQILLLSPSGTYHLFSLSMATTLAYSLASWCQCLGSLTGPPASIITTQQSVLYTAATQSASNILIKLYSPNFSLQWLPTGLLF